MNGNLYLDVLFIFLIVYAAVHMLHGIGCWIMKGITQRTCVDCIVLTLSGGCGTMEMSIRNAVSASLRISRALVIVDTGINKEEQFLLWRLTDAYDHIILATPENLSEKIGIAQSLTKTL